MQTNQRMRESDFVSCFAEPTRQKAITWDMWAISVSPKPVDSASYNRGPDKMGQLASHVIQILK